MGTSKANPLDTKENWERLARMAIAAMHYGVRIEQDGGHRYIFADPDADFYCNAVDPDVNPDLRHKQYGSFQRALNNLDAALTAAGQKGLIQCSQDLDHYSDLGTLLGTGPVE